MPSRVSPTDRIRADIDALFPADRALGDVLENVVRLGVRLILQTALEAEYTEFLRRPSSPGSSGTLTVHNEEDADHAFTIDELDIG